MTGSPESDLPEARALAAAFEPWQGMTLDIRPLSGGITNRNFVVCSALGRHVLRLPGARTELLGISRAQELLATRQAAELGVGPPVLGVLPGAGTPIAQWVAGRHLSGAEFAQRLDEVVLLLRSFHGSARLTSSFAVHRVVEHHVRDAAAHGVAAPASWPELQRISRRIELAFARAPQPALACHNDLLPANLLFDTDRVWLLDYEYAGLNERFFDLANLAVNAGLDEAGEQALLRLYLGHDAGWAWSRLQLMKVMSELREGLWALVQQAISTLDTDFVAYTAQHLANAARMAGSSDFGGWMEQAAQAPAA